MSVKQVMRAGNRVVFDEEGTYIKDKVTGEKIWAADDGGMLMEMDSDGGLKVTIRQTE